MTRYLPIGPSIPVSSGFGQRWGTNHNGIDYAAAVGTPIYAAADGTVVEGKGRTGVAGFGSWIWIDCQASEGVDLIYGHVQQSGILVGRGDRVRAGQQIGVSGNEGNTTGPHLHFEVWDSPGRIGGTPRDPAPWLNGAADPTKQKAPAPVSGMTAEVLSSAMGCSLSRAREMLPGMVGAMRAANINNPLRAAHWCAQIGHESAGLVYMEEIDSGERYNGRTDLGNVHPGDGPRFKGSGPIQLTGRHNFTLFSAWAHKNGHTPTERYLVDNPHLVRQNPVFGFLAASWYWTVARPQLNQLADADDLVGVTRAINGGTNGIDDRRRRLGICKNLGTKLLPPTATGGLTVSDMKTIVAKLDGIERRVARIEDQLGPKRDDWGEDSSFGKDSQGRERTLRDGVIAGLNDIKKAVTK